VKCEFSLEEGSATEPQRHIAKEELEWLVSNKWLTIITTPPLSFISVQRVLSSLERTLVEVLILGGLWEKRVCIRVIVLGRRVVRELERARA